MASTFVYSDIRFLCIQVVKNKMRVWNNGALQRITLTVRAGCHNLVVPNIQNNVCTWSEIKDGKTVKQPSS